MIHYIIDFLLLSYSIYLYNLSLSNDQNINTNITKLEDKYWRDIKFKLNDYTQKTNEMEKDLVRLKEKYQHQRQEFINYKKGYK